VYPQSGSQSRGQSAGHEDLSHPQAIDWQWDLDSHHLSIDESLCQQILNSDLPTLTGNVLLPCMAYHDQQQWLGLLTEACQSRSQHSYSCCLQLSDDQCCYVEFSFKGVERHRVVGSLRVLLFLHATTSTLSALFSQLFNNGHHGVVLANHQREIIACNDAFLAHSHYHNGQLAGQSMDVLNSNKHSDDFYRAIWQQVENEGHWSGVVLIQNALGKTYAQDLTLQKVTLVEGTFYCAVYLDLSDHLYRIADVELGGVDLLTQLPTEKQFNHAVASDWMEQTEPVICMVVAFHPDFEQVDDFEIKALLSEQLTLNPVAKYVGYLGNNHFVACLECQVLAGPSKVRLIHQTIRRFFSALNQSCGSGVHRAILHGRVGVSVLWHDTHKPNLLVNHAVQAMLEQSVEQRGQISFYHGALHKEVLRRKEMEEWAEQQIKSQSVEVYYQPIVDVRNWDVVRFEALSRFKGPDGRLLNTQEMVMIAEDLDLVSDLDWCIGKRALHDLNTIQQRFGAQIGVTINRSLNTKLEVDEVLQSAHSLIQTYAQLPNTVTIELTESAYFDSESRRSSLIRNIRRQGVSIAIDDFGTGYSSFAYLSDCNFDVLKIDREFIKDLKPNTRQYYIVKMITQLAHTLEVKVVAEGVETYEELEVVCSVGVDYIQGYFFSKPLPLRDLEQAWGYYDRLERFLSGSNCARRDSLLTLCKMHTPSLAPNDTLMRAYELFHSEQHQLEVIPIVDGKKCVGVVGREQLNHHISPTLGTKLETTRDLLMAKKTLNQVMRTQLFTASYHTKLSQTKELIQSGIKPPWLVVNDADEFLGVVTNQDLLHYFTDG